MNNQQIKSLLTEHLNKPAFNVDMAVSIMNRIHTPKRMTMRRMLLIAALFALLASATYAAVISIIELKNKDGSTDFEIAITENSSAEDIKIASPVTQFEDFDTNDIPEELKDKPCITLSIEDPTKYNIHNTSYFINEYDEMTKILDPTFMPDAFGEFTFERVLLVYSINIPSQETLNTIASNHPSKKYHTFALTYDEVGVSFYEYMYQDLRYTVQLTPNIDDRTYDQDQLKQHEVISLGATEAFVIIRDNLDFYFDKDGKSITKTYENNYQILWKQGDYEYSIRPSHRNVDYPDFKDRSIGSYPEETKDQLIQFATLIHNHLSEKN